MEPVFPEIHELRGLSFFGECLKFNIDFKSARKNSKKVFLFQIIVSEFFGLNCL